MNVRKIACLCAAGFVGSLLITAAGSAAPRQRQPDLVVEGHRIDPATQREVSFADLNLAFKPGQKVLRHRISVAANEICTSISSNSTAIEDCRWFAINGTRDAVKGAIRRAELRMAAGQPAATDITAIAFAVAVR